MCSYSYIIHFKFFFQVSTGFKIVFLSVSECEYDGLIVLWNFSRMGVTRSVTNCIVTVPQCASGCNEYSVVLGDPQSVPPLYSIISFNHIELCPDL
jgi:hypothetical protein